MESVERQLRSNIGPRTIPSEQDGASEETAG